MLDFLKGVWDGLKEFAKALWDGALIVVEAVVDILFGVGCFFLVFAIIGAIGTAGIPVILILLAIMGSLYVIESLAAA